GPGCATRSSCVLCGRRVGGGDRRARLRSIHRQTAERKRHHDAETLDALFSDLALFAPPLERLLTRVTGTSRAFAVNVSNIPGPRDPVRVLGAGLEELL